MNKDSLISFRADDLLNDQIKAAAKRKDMSVSDFIRESLVEKAEFVLMGDRLAKTSLNEAMLHDIWKRMIYIQGYIKIPLLNPQQKLTCRDRHYQCEDYAYEETESIKEKVEDNLYHI